MVKYKKIFISIVCILLGTVAIGTKYQKFYKRSRYKDISTIRYSPPKLSSTHYYTIKNKTSDLSFIFPNIKHLKYTINLNTNSNFNNIMFCSEESIYGFKNMYFLTSLPHKLIKIKKKKNDLKINNKKQILRVSKQLGGLKADSAFTQFINYSNYSKKTAHNIFSLENVTKLYINGNNKNTKYHSNRKTLKETKIVSFWNKVKSWIISHQLYSVLIGTGGFFIFATTIFITGSLAIIRKIRKKKLIIKNTKNNESLLDARKTSGVIITEDTDLYRIIIKKDDGGHDGTQKTWSRDSTELVRCNRKQFIPSYLPQPQNLKKETAPDLVTETLPKLSSTSPKLSSTSPKLSSTSHNLPRTSSDSPVSSTESLTFNPDYYIINDSTKSTNNPINNSQSDFIPSTFRKNDPVGIPAKCVEAIIFEKDRNPQRKATIPLYSDDNCTTPPRFGSHVLPVKEFVEPKISEEIDLHVNSPVIQSDKLHHNDNSNPNLVCEDSDIEEDLEDYAIINNDEIEKAKSTLLVSTEEEINSMLIHTLRGF